MEFLPEDCFAHILSFTTPQNMCWYSLISSTVQSMANSDSVWEKFLPLNYPEIVTRLVDPSLPCPSKKELFVRLCKPKLIDDGNKVASACSGGGANMNFPCNEFIFAALPMFSIEKRTGKICYLLSARELSIAWGNSPLYWSWKPVQGSRFAEAAELRTICWLEIRGSINTAMLSPQTLYGAYLKVKIADRAFALDSLPLSEVSVEVGKHKTQGTVIIRSRTQRNEKASCQCLCGPEEIEFGSFYTESDNNDDVVRMCLKEVKLEMWANC